MPQPRNPNYAVPLDYSWNDLKLRTEKVIREARRIVESTRMVLAHSQQIPRIYLSRTSRLGDISM